jgi:hypothetical protein
MGRIRVPSSDYYSRDVAVVNRISADPAIEVTLRLPGTWEHPRELVERLPAGCRLTAEELILPTGKRFEFNALDADEDFPGVFAGSCPKLPTEEEREQIENYTVNVCLTGPGGSLEAAYDLMQAAAVLIEAGAAGVFVDNSGISHGATDWLTLTESRHNGGVYWAFVTTVRNDDELYSMGMHILGFPEAVIPRTSDEEIDFRTLHSFLGYSYASGATIKDGDVVGDPILPTFRVYHGPHDRLPPGTPMSNPFGQWRLKPFVPENN